MNRTSYSLGQARSMLPFLEAVTRELRDRREERRWLVRARTELEDSCSPEGLHLALGELDARIFEHDEALRRARAELERLGLSVLRVHPLTIHIPGASAGQEVTFCWQEGDATVCHGHAAGEEDDPRRPLRVRASRAT